MQNRVKTLKDFKVNYSSDQKSDIPETSHLSIQELFEQVKKASANEACLLKMRLFERFYTTSIDEFAESKDPGNELVRLFNEENQVFANILVKIKNEMEDGQIADAKKTIAAAKTQIKKFQLVQESALASLDNFENYLAQSVYVAKEMRDKNSQYQNYLNHLMLIEILKYNPVFVLSNSQLILCLRELEQDVNEMGKLDLGFAVPYIMTRMALDSLKMRHEYMSRFVKDTPVKKEGRPTLEEFESKSNAQPSSSFIMMMKALIADRKETTQQALTSNFEGHVSQACADIETAILDGDVVRPLAIMKKAMQQYKNDHAATKNLIVRFKPLFERFKEFLDTEQLNECQKLLQIEASAQSKESFSLSLDLRP